MQRGIATTLILLVPATGFLAGCANSSTSGSGSLGELLAQPAAAIAAFAGTLAYDSAESGAAHDELLYGSTDFFKTQDMKQAREFEASENRHPSN